MYDIVVIGNPAYYKNETMELASGAVYAAITASKLGVENVAFIGAVGNDLRQQLVQVFDEHDIEFFLIDSTETNRFLVSLDIQGTRFVDLLGARREIGIRDIPDEFLNAKAILLSPVLREVHTELIKWLSDSSDSMIFLDPRFRRISEDDRIRLMGNHGVVEEVLSFIDLVKLNRLESMIITGEEDPFLAVEMLVESGSDLAIVTLSEEGSIAFDGKDFYRIPAFKIKKRNEIGIGDSYLSGFAAMMLEERPIAECGAFASAVASIVAESTAGPDFILDRREIQRRTEVLLEEIAVR
jgi:sugar/nucleoside kinase (ribokinase family)